MQLYLNAGHKIGKPEPLFTKIEQERLDELKKRYGGSQSTNNVPASEKPAATGGKFTSVAEAEKAVAAQGDKVRALKSSGAEKPVVQEQVAILLALKKQLAELQSGASATEKVVANGVATSPAPTAASNTAKIAEIEAAIVKQGEKVRDLKASGDKSVWQPEVDKLLALKKELVAAGGQPAPAPQSSGKSKKKKWSTVTFVSTMYNPLY